MNGLQIGSKEKCTSLSSATKKERANKDLQYKVLNHEADVVGKIGIRGAFVFVSSVCKSIY